MLVRTATVFALALACAAGCAAPPESITDGPIDVLISSDEEATEGWVEIGEVPYSEEGIEECMYTCYQCVYPRGMPNCDAWAQGQATGDYRVTSPAGTEQALCACLTSY